MCLSQSTFPNENKPQKLIQVPLGLEASLKSLKYKFRFSFCFMDEKKIMVQAGFWLSSTPSRTPPATQKQDKSMMGVFCHMGR